MSAGFPRGVKLAGQYLLRSQPRLHMKNRYALLLPALLVLGATNGQSYCAPSFVNGCFSWNNTQVSVGGIDWSTDGDCSNFDHTDLVATAEAGETLAMSVTSGAWTGCAVWVDLDNSESFEENENLYYGYVGGSPTYDYIFTITVPAGTTPGLYRMRVIAPWGSDGFLSTNTNGFGPCGAFQYGNFDDFSLEVSGLVDGIHESDAAALIARPNPTEGAVSFSSSAGDPLLGVTLTTADGRTVQRFVPAAASTRIVLELGGLPAGVYLARCWLAHGVRTVRLVKV